MIVWRDGEWLAVADISIPADDRGFLLGDGLFETMRFQDGALIRRAAHTERLRASCQQLALPDLLDDFNLDEIVQALAAKNGLEKAAIRLTLTAGAGQRGLRRSRDGQVSVLLSASPLAPPAESLALSVSDIRREPSSHAARHKTLSYIDNVAARVGAEKAGAGMALMLTSKGHLSGCDCANVFWVSGSKLFTPSLECAVLPGISRAHLIETMDVTQGQFELEAVLRAEHVFVTNALMGAVGVSGIDNQVFESSCAVLDLAKSALG